MGLVLLNLVLRDPGQPLIPWDSSQRQLEAEESINPGRLGIEGGFGAGKIQGVEAQYGNDQVTDVKFRRKRALGTLKIIREVFEIQMSSMRRMRNRKDEEQSKGSAKNTGILRICQQGQGEPGRRGKAWRGVLEVL